MIDDNAINLVLLGFRLSAAAVMLAHGFNHIFGGGKIAGTGRWFESLGMKPGRVHAWVASLTEVGAGALLVLGLFTPLAAAGIIGVMLVALIINHRGNGFFIFRPGEGWEYVMVLTAMGVALGTLGPGSWSIDGHVHALRSLWGWPGFAISAGGGAAATALLLATCWRPQRPAMAHSRSIKSETVLRGGCRSSPRSAGNSTHRWTSRPCGLHKVHALTLSSRRVLMGRPLSVNMSASTLSRLEILWCRPTPMGRCGFTSLPISRSASFPHGRF